MKNKTLFLFSILLFAFFYSFGQIKITEIAPLDKKDIVMPPYDSLYQVITKENYKKYIGQKLYILPYSKLYFSFRDSTSSAIEIKGYSGFSNSLISSYNGAKENQYKPVNHKHKYDYFSDAKALSGKYFEITDIIDQTDELKFNVYQAGLYLKLRGENKKDNYLFYQLGLKSTKGPFIVVGYYEKLKYLNQNKKYILQKNIEANDINTGKKLNIKSGSEWTCIDVTLIETRENYLVEPVFIYKDSTNNQIVVKIRGKQGNINMVGVGEFKSLVGRDDFKSKDAVVLEKQKQEEEKIRQLAEYEKSENERELEIKNHKTNEKLIANEKKEMLIKKYGNNLGTLISKGEVAVGMSKEMCLASWGSPEDINRTITIYGIHEQWVYNLKSYLYFEGDVLTTIQN